MSLTVNVLGLSQKVDFADGSVSNMIHLELPSGTQIVALVTDEGAKQFLVEVQAAAHLFKEAPAVPQQEVRAAPQQYVREVPLDAFTFGEDGFTSAPEEEEDEPVVPPQLGPQLVRMGHRGADAAGNPVDTDGIPLYQKAAARAPEADGGNVDEDGVPGL